ncbi:MAG: hypothetical protein QXL27_09410 [Candidatus Bathyarchaeia archaeon]
MYIPRLKDIVEPTQLVEAYSRLSPGEYAGRLAPSLGMIIEHELFDSRVVVSDEFLDTITFLSITHLDPMVEALKMVNGGLKVIREAPVALSLTQEMGFGKTHFLTLLWHLYAQTYRWNVKDVEEALDPNVLWKSNYDRRVAERALIFVIDMLRYPRDLKPYDAIFEIAARILERKSKIHGVETLDPSFLRNLSKLRPIEAVKTLISNLRESTPILIVVDELYGGARDIIAGGSIERIRSLMDLVSFLKELLESSRGVVPLVFIYASAQQDVERWSRVTKYLTHSETDRTIPLLVDTIDELNDRVGRLKPSTLKPLEVEDVLNILALRLLRFKARRQDVMQILQKHIEEEFTGLIGKDETLNFTRRLNKFYPFSPSYEVLLLKFIHPTFGADLPKSQHIRDLLKVTAALISRLMAMKWSECTLISIAHLAPEDFSYVMSERLAREWMRIYDSCESVIQKVGDEDVRELMLAMLSTVYAKSITENVVKLLDMLRAPEVRSRVERTEIELRATTKLDIVTTLIGAMAEERFKKFNEAFEHFKRLPYLNSFEYGGLEYYIITLLPSPSELIDQMTEEERKKAGVDKSDYETMLEYFKDHLIRQYSLTGFFQSRSGRVAPPKLYLIDWTKHVVSFKDKPEFIDLLDRDAFTILTVSPWSILEASLLGKPKANYVEEVEAIIRKYRSEIPYVNMFAMVIPEASPEDLSRLCSQIASVNAASTAINYLKIGEPEQAKRRRLDMIKRGPTIPTLKDYFRSEQEFEEVLLEIMEYMHRKIESYAASLASSAISNYTADLINLFKTVVYYDPTTDSITHGDLRVTPERTANEFKDIYGELPAWILSAVSGKCNIRKTPDIKASLIEYIKKYAEKHKSVLLADRRLEVDSTYIVESVVKGWSEIPIKPVSKSAVESAVKILSGTYSLIDPEINEIKVSIEDAKIMIERVRLPLPPPPEEYNIVEVHGINNVIIMVAYFDKLKPHLSNIQAVDFSLNIRGGSVNLSKLPLEVVEALNIKNLLEKFRSNVTNVSLTMYFEEKMKREKMLEQFRKIGVDENMIKLKKTGG